MRGARRCLPARRVALALMCAAFLALASAATTLAAAATPSPGPTASPSPRPSASATATPGGSPTASPTPTRSASPTALPTPSPARAPGPPGNLRAVPGDASATLTWAASAPNGSPVTRYTVTVAPGGEKVVVPGDRTTAVVTRLVNGRGYTFTVTATNAVGTSTPATSSIVTPRTVPAAPTAVMATAGDTTATISWKVPSSDGGSPILRYMVASAPDARSATAPAGTTRATVTGLKNGTAYTFVLSATNAAGSSPLSAPSNPVTPAAAAPAPPTGVEADPGDASATVRWLPPAAGGSPIVRYTVTASPSGARAIAKGDVTRASVGGLANGTAYTFTVTATNAVGTSAPSAPSRAVVPKAPVAPPRPPAPAPVPNPATGSAAETPTPGGPAPAEALPTLPDPPERAVAAARFQSAVVDWSPPHSDGGAPITSYTVASSPDGAVVSVDGDTTRVTIPGLSNWILYTFTVTATNAVGTGPPSAESAGVTPELVEPDAPTDVGVAVGDGAATVTWGPPESDGGSPVTAYLVTAMPDGRTVRVGPDAGSTTLTGLFNGSAYRFLVEAINDRGTGQAAISEEVVPAAEPDAPSAVTAQSFETGAIVSWSPPDWDGGKPIIAYTVTASPAGLSVTVDGNATSVTLTGLLDGRLYTFSVTASNALATSAPSPPSIEVLPDGDCDEFCDDDEFLDADPMSLTTVPVRL